MRWPLQPLQPLQKAQLQLLVGSSVDSLCHPWFTTTNLSCRFPIFETSATALCGTTGNPYSWIDDRPAIRVYNPTLIVARRICNQQCWFLLSQPATLAAKGFLSGIIWVNYTVSTTWNKVHNGDDCLNPNHDSSEVTRIYPDLISSKFIGAAAGIQQLASHLRPHPT